MDNNQKINQVKEHYNSLLHLTELAKYIQENTNSLVAAKSEYKKMIAESEQIKKDLQQQADINFINNFTQSMMSKRSEIEFLVKKLRFLAQSILADSELL
jgi:hypothetical protein